MIYKFTCTLPTNHPKYISHFYLASCEKDKYSTVERLFSCLVKRGNLDAHCARIMPHSDHSWGYVSIVDQGNWITAFTINPLSATKSVKKPLPTKPVKINMISNMGVVSYPYHYYITPG
jgi:hypothetical protein